MTKQALHNFMYFLYFMYFKNLLCFQEIHESHKALHFMYLMFSLNVQGPTLKTSMSPKARACDRRITT